MVEPSPTRALGWSLAMALVLAGVACTATPIEIPLNDAAGYQPPLDAGPGAEPDGKRTDTALPPPGPPDSGWEGGDGGASDADWNGDAEAGVGPDAGDGGLINDGPASDGPASDGSSADALIGDAGGDQGADLEAAVDGGNDA